MCIVLVNMKLGNGIENCNVDWMMISIKGEMFFFAIKDIGIVN